MSIFTRFTWTPAPAPADVPMGEYTEGQQHTQIGDYTVHVGVFPYAYDGRIIAMDGGCVHLDSISGHCWDDLDELLGDSWMHDMVQYTEDIVQELEDEQR